MPEGMKPGPAEFETPGDLEDHSQDPDLGIPTGENHDVNLTEEELADSEYRNDLTDESEESDEAE